MGKHKGVQAVATIIVIALGGCAAAQTPNAPVTPSQTQRPVSQAPSPVASTPNATVAGTPLTAEYNIILFATNRDKNGGMDEIYMMHPDGTGAHRLTDDPAEDWMPALSPDRSAIAFSSGRGGGANEIYVMAIDGSAVRRVASSSGTSTGRHGRWITGLIQGQPDQVDDTLVILDAEGTTPPAPIAGSAIGSGSWQRLAP
jgi:hypothetical protein